MYVCKYVPFDAFKVNLGVQSFYAWASKCSLYLLMHTWKQKIQTKLNSISTSGISSTNKSYSGKTMKTVDEYLMNTYNQAVMFLSLLQLLVLQKCNVCCNGYRKEK